MAAKLEESNIAMLGSDLEKEVRKAAAESAEEWIGAGQSVGIEIWRIEALSVQKWPEDQYGSFYEGDSYIILNTYPKPESEQLLYNVHFWLGESTSQDEAGIAAYKTVELDDLLGTLPVQFREVMDHESSEFLTLFEPGIKILAGGVESGFNHVEPESYEPRLLQIKGRMKNISVRQVALSCDSLNDGDVFILDAGLTVYSWTGGAAGHFEKNKASGVLNQILDERNGKASKIYLDAGDDDEDFFALLGGAGDIKDAAAGGDDADAQAVEKKLVRLSDASGEMVMTVEATGSFGVGDLDSADVFIIENNGILFVWIGSETSDSEKKNAFKYANDYIGDNNLPFSTPVRRVVEGATNAAFDRCFD